MTTRRQLLKIKGMSEAKVEKIKVSEECTKRYNRRQGYLNFQRRKLHRRSRVPLLQRGLRSKIVVGGYLLSAQAVNLSTLFLVVRRSYTRLSNKIG